MYWKSVTRGRELLSLSFILSVGIFYLVHLLVHLYFIYSVRADISIQSYGNNLHMAGPIYAFIMHNYMVSICKLLLQ